MDMKMRHGFTGVRTVVDDEAKAVREVQLLRDLASDEQQMPEYALIGGGGFAHAGDNFFRHDQQVHGRLGLDVVEDDAVLVLVLELRGDFAGDDTFENRFGHGFGGKIVEVDVATGGGAGPRCRRVPRGRYRNKS